MVPFKSIGIDYRQISALKVSAIPQSILRSKTMTDTEKVSAISLLYRDIKNPENVAFVCNEIKKTIDEPN
jgi:hypothetical protein